MTQIDPSQLQFIPVDALSVPPEGPIGVPLQLDFTRNSSFILDLQNFTAQNKISMVQGIYMLNPSTSSATILCVESRTGVTIPCPVGFGTYAPLPTANPSTLLFFGVGDPNEICKVLLLNYPVEPAQLSGF